MASPQARIALLLVTGLLIAIAAVDNYQKLLVFVEKDYSIAIAIAALALTGYQIWQTSQSNFNDKLEDLSSKALRDTEDLEKRQIKYLRDFEQRISQQFNQIDRRMDYFESVLQELVFKTKVHECMPGHDKAMIQIESLKEQVLEVRAITSILINSFSCSISATNQGGSSESSSGT